MSTSEVIVIGGGITGCATAYELSKRGVQVTVIEREAIHAMGSGWTLAGVRQSGRHAAELPIAREAIKRWPTLGEELGAELDYTQNGNLRLALTPEQEPAIRQVVADGNAAGVPMEYIAGADAVRAIAPEVTDTVAGASFCATDGHADNHKTVTAYAAAAKRLGVRFVLGEEVLNLVANANKVTGVVTSNGTHSADAVVVAAGIYSPQLLAPLGLELPLQVMYTPIAQTIPCPEFKLKQVIGIAGGSFAARQTASGAVRFIGASTPWNESRHTSANMGMTVTQMVNMTTRATDILPGLGDIRIERVWGGLTDDTQDRLPVFDTPAYDGLIVGAGLNGHGFGIGPATGEILANLAINGDDSRFDLTPFRLKRLEGGTVGVHAHLYG